MSYRKGPNLPLWRQCPVTATKPIFFLSFLQPSVVMVSTTVVRTDKHIFKLIRIYILNRCIITSVHASIQYDLERFFVLFCFHLVFFLQLTMWRMCKRPRLDFLHIHLMVLSIISNILCLKWSLSSLAHLRGCIFFYPHTAEILNKVFLTPKIWSVIEIIQYFLTRGTSHQKKKFHRL